MSAEMISDLRFTRTIAAFDQANANDPRQEPDENGIPVAYEVLYARRMSDALLRFCPQASEALQLAARSQHIERWLLPRDHYPMDRKGYLQWRSELKLRHAARAGEIMLAEGYDAAMCERVAALLKKEKLKSDEESQTLEDVICLVFLQYYFEEFAKVNHETKLIDILQKTW
ncbi:MAG: DUF4202 domain-containing protein, partial [Gammaproteobacteria bacterium]|nr:DUF4202 domain-containing protein [Gammaproteobacteria bacterium]